MHLRFALQVAKERRKKLGHFKYCHFAHSTEINLQVVILPGAAIDTPSFFQYIRLYARMKLLEKHLTDFHEI
jgi:hypothetical protein